MQDRAIAAAYEAAKDRYAAMGVDVETAIRNLESIPISLHCWQGDDVGGFENAGGELGGGIAATGNYPGKARTPDELRADAGEGAVADPRHAPLQPARLLRRDRRPARRARRDRAGAFRRLDRLGRRRTASAWTSTRPTSRTRRPPTTSRCRTPTRRSASSGSSTASPAGGSARRSARRSARLRDERLDPRRL